MTSLRSNRHRVGGIRVGLSWPRAPSRASCHGGPGRVSSDLSVVNVGGRRRAPGDAADVVASTRRAASSTVMSARPPATSRPRSARPRRSAGVDVTVAERVRHGAPSQRDEVAHRSVEGQHAAGEHAAGVAHLATGDGDVVRTERAVVRAGAATASVTRLSRRGPSARHAMRTADRIDVDAVADQPGDDRSSASAAPIGPGSRWPNGRIALNRWVT